MATISKKDMIDRISRQTSLKQVSVKHVVQTLLENITEELCRGNRVEFRDFGVFEARLYSRSIGHNPKTRQLISFKPRRLVRFRVGQRLKKLVHEHSAAFDEATGLPLPGKDLTPVNLKA